MYPGFDANSQAKRPENFTLTQTAMGSPLQPNPYSPLNNIISTSPHNYSSHNSFSFPHNPVPSLHPNPYADLDHQYSRSLTPRSLFNPSHFDNSVPLSQPANPYSLFYPSSFPHYPSNFSPQQFSANYPTYSQIHQPNLSQFQNLALQHQLHQHPNQTNQPDASQLQALVLQNQLHQYSAQPNQPDASQL